MATKKLRRRGYICECVLHKTDVLMFGIKFCFVTRLPYSVKNEERKNGTEYEESE